MPVNAAELLVELGESGTGPLRVRLANALRDAIRTGRLTPGAILPSTRVLAEDLGISRGPVVDAYGQLAAEGFIHSRPGAATTVAFLPETRLPPDWHSERPHAVPGPDLDLRLGSPDLTAFPRRKWSAAIRGAIMHLPTAALGYCEPWGAWELRHQLGIYLSRVRGAMAATEGVIVVNGATQGLSLLARTLLMQGHSEIAVEDPSNPVQRDLLTRLGFKLVDIPIDRDGLSVDDLANSGARAVICTPSRQYPSGIVMSAGRRERLLAWAADRDGLIIEEEQGAEFSSDRTRLACLQAMDPVHIVLLGSVSQSLAPALRLGWMLTPPQLLNALRSAKQDDDLGTNTLEQHALASMLETGDYDRHLRRMRKRYQQRRDAFIGRLHHYLPDLTVTGSSGLHLTITLPPGIDENQIVESAATTGLAISGLQAFTGRTARPPAIVVSYARLTPDMADEAVARLSSALEEVALRLTAAVPPPSSQ